MIWGTSDECPPTHTNTLTQSHTYKNNVRTDPDPELWPLPYSYFAIGRGTDCPSSHFKNMRLVFNLAFCGSVAGTRFPLDCPKLQTQYESCEKYIEADTEELKEAYWEVNSVTIFEREIINAGGLKGATRR